MLGLNLSINTVFIIIIGYIVFLIINTQFKENTNNNDKYNEGFENENEVRPTPIGNDKEDKRYKLLDNIKKTGNTGKTGKTGNTGNNKDKETCDRNFDSSCLPFNINEIPPEKEYIEPSPGMDNLQGLNFLNAKYHSQVNKVGNFKGNMKVDIRPEPINPQVGVSPTSQSVINIDWNNDEKVLLYDQNYSDIWKRLI